MAYNNNYRSNSNYRNNNNNDNYRNQPAKKKSGCKLGRTSTDRAMITGWNVSKSRGFITLVATILDEVVKSKRREYVKAVCNITFRDRGNKITTSGFYDAGSRKLYIPELSMVASVNAPNGGYFGTVRVQK